MASAGVVRSRTATAESRMGFGYGGRCTTSSSGASEAETATTSVASGCPSSAVYSASTNEHEIPYPDGRRIPACTGDSSGQV